MAHWEGEKDKSSLILEQEEFDRLPTAIKEDNGSTCVFYQQDAWLAMLGGILLILWGAPQLSLVARVRRGALITLAVVFIVQGALPLLLIVAGVYYLRGRWPIWPAASYAAVSMAAAIALLCASWRLPDRASPERGFPVNVEGGTLGTGDSEASCADGSSVGFGTGSRNGNVPINKLYVTLLNAIGAKNGDGSAITQFGMADSNTVDAGITNPGELTDLKA